MWRWMMMVMGVVGALNGWAQRGDVDGGERKKIRWEGKGRADSYHAWGLVKGKNWMASRTRVRGEGRMRERYVSGLVSMNALYNGVMEEYSGVKLREAWVDFSRGGWEVKGGRQLVMWGVADGIRVTDVVCGMDYSEFLAQDYDDMRVPMTGLRVRYGWKNVTLEGIWVPVAGFDCIPTENDNPWAWNGGEEMRGWVWDLKSKRPRRNLKGMEYGGRMRWNKMGMDMALCVWRSWNKLPEMLMEVDEKGDGKKMVGRYERLTVLGAEWAMPWGEMCG